MLKKVLAAAALAYLIWRMKQIKYNLNGLHLLDCPWSSRRNRLLNTTLAVGCYNCCRILHTYHPGTGAGRWKKKCRWNHLIHFHFFFRIVSSSYSLLEAFSCCFRLKKSSFCALKDSEPKSGTPSPPPPPPDKDMSAPPADIPEEYDLLEDIPDEAEDRGGRFFSVRTLDVDSLHEPPWDSIRTWKETRNWFMQIATKTIIPKQHCRNKYLALSGLTLSL